jgi:hypothetical protein
MGTLTSSQDWNGSMAMVDMIARWAVASCAFASV